MTRVRRLLPGLAAMAVAAVVLAGCIRDDPYQFKGGLFEPAAAAAPIELTDQHGNPFSLSAMNGEVVLVYFGYTTCPDLCPTTLSDFTAVKTMLGDDAENVRFVMVTVDPERDTGERLAQYLAFFDDEFVGLHGEVEEIEAVKNGYGVIANKVEYPDSATGYLVDHTSLIYVIDRDGNLLLTYPYGFDPESIAEDIRHLV